MTRLFLNAKHWQLFLAIAGLPLLIQGVFMFQIFQNIQQDPSVNIAVFQEVFQLFPAVTLFSTLVFFGWFWAIAIGLQKQIPSHLALNTKRFKLFFFIPLCYTTFLYCLLMFLFSEINTAQPHLHMRWLVLLMPLHLLSMFCMFYILYFSAKTLKTALLQRNVTFKDYAAEFFLLWFYIIGLWIIQPKVNALFSNTSHAKTHTD